MNQNNDSTKIKPSLIAEHGLDLAYVINLTEDLYTFVLAYNLGLGNKEFARDITSLVGLYLRQYATSSDLPVARLDIVGEPTKKFRKSGKWVAIEPLVLQKDTELPRFGEQKRQLSLASAVVVLDMYDDEARWADIVSAGIVEYSTGQIWVTRRDEASPGDHLLLKGHLPQYERLEQLEKEPPTAKNLKLTTSHERPIDNLQNSLLYGDFGPYVSSHLTLPSVQGEEITLDLQNMAEASTQLDVAGFYSSTVPGIRAAAGYSIAKAAKAFTVAYDTRNCGVVNFVPEAKQSLIISAIENLGRILFLQLSGRLAESLKPR